MTTVTTSTFVPCSEKQLFWVKKLVDEKNIADTLREEIKAALISNSVSKHLATQYLDTLFSAQDIVAPGAVTEEGFYDTGEGAIYRVKQSLTSGKLYALRVTSKGFVYAAGMIKNLKASMRMTVDQIVAYGLATGICCNCSTLLTDPISIFVGLGTKCGPTIMGPEAYKEAKKAAKSDPATAKAIAEKKALQNPPVVLETLF